MYLSYLYTQVSLSLSQVPPQPCAFHGHSVGGPVPTPSPGHRAPLRAVPRSNPSSPVPCRTVMCHGSVLGSPMSCALSGLPETAAVATAT